MSYRIYEVTFPSGEICTRKAVSPVGAVAMFSGRSRHSWQKTVDGLAVTARLGDGTNLTTYLVKQSCFETLPE
jgi:hypothetical protein